jgi:hypothetical protein
MYPAIIISVAHLGQTGPPLLFQIQVGKKKETPSVLVQSNSKEIK